MTKQKGKCKDKGNLFFIIFMLDVATLIQLLGARKFVKQTSSKPKSLLTWGKPKFIYKSDLKLSMGSDFSCCIYNWLVLYFWVFFFFFFANTGGVYLLTEIEAASAEKVGILYLHQVNFLLNPPEKVIVNPILAFFWRFFIREIIGFNAEFGSNKTFQLLGKSILFSIWNKFGDSSWYKLFELLAQLHGHSFFIFFVPESKEKKTEKSNWKCFIHFTILMKGIQFSILPREEFFHYAIDVMSYYIGGIFNL